MCLPNTLVIEPLFVQMRALLLAVCLVITAGVRYMKQIPAQPGTQVIGTLQVRSSQVCV